MRIGTRLVSALVALALLVGGLLAALEIIAAGLGREEDLVVPWRDWRQDALDTPWEDPDVRLILALVLLAGLLLLFLILVRRPPQAIRLQPRADGASAELDRSGLERYLGSKLSRVDGVASTRVRVRGGKARVEAVTPGRETGTVEHAVGAAADAALAQLGLASPMPVRVSVTSRREA